MRILCASRNFFPAGIIGGAQASLALLARQFEAAGHQVAVLSIDDTAREGIHAATGLPEYRLSLRHLAARGERSAAGKVVWHGIDRFGNLMEASYRDVIARFRPDVVFTHVLAGLSLAIWRAARAEGVPVVHMVHDYYPLCIRSAMRRKGQNCAGICGLCRWSALSPARAAQDAVAGVIYVSEHMRRAYNAAGLFVAQPSRIIIGSYEPQLPVPPRAGLIAPDRLTLGYFGRLSAEKGLLELISMLRTTGGVPWRLRIGGAGDAAFLADLRRAADGLPIDILGVQSPDAFFAEIDTLIVPSLWNDPAPRVVYEAGLHGVIPVVNTAGGLAELVEHGRRGFVFRAEDPATLAVALLQIFSNPDRVAAIRQAWRDAAPAFSHAAVAGAALEMLAAAAGLSETPPIPPDARPCVAADATA